MARTVVGVDIGGNAVRAVEVQGYESAKPSVVRYGEIALPEGAARRGEVIEQATVATALKRLWATAHFGSKEVVLGMGGQRVFARDLVVPRAPIEQIRESLPFQVQELLPVPVADALLDFYPLGEVQGETGPMLNGLLIAGFKDAIKANVDAVTAAGLRPRHVDFIPFAQCRAIAPVRAARGRDVIVSIGATTTNIVVVDDGVPHFVRILPNGGDDVTQALVQQMQWSPEQAEQAKRAIGMGGAMMRAEDRPIIEVIYRAVGELLTSVRSTISYFAGARPTEAAQRIILSGGGARLTGLPNALSELTRMPVSAAEPLSGVPTGRSRLDPAQADGYVTAFGLALGSHA
jgi:type IV pilus assembly protein PilM